jgi:DNA-binding CsgD family transcriptional regulator/PAS domain-containing protein
MLASQDDLLLKLYDTVQQPQSWRGFLDQVCETVQVRSAVVQRLIPAGESMMTTWLAYDTYSEEYAGQHALVVNDAMNPRFHYDYQSPPPPGGIGVACDEDIAMPADVRRRFQDDLADVGLGKGIFAGASLTPFEGVSLILHRHPDMKRDYSTQDRAFLSQLMPHLTQALTLSDRLSRSTNRVRAMEQILDTVRPAIFVCDSHANVVWSNKSAEDMLRQSQTLKVISGRLTCSMHDLTMDLHALIWRAGQADDAPCRDTQSLIIDQGASTRPHLTVIPLKARDGDLGGRVAVFFGHTGAPFDVPKGMLEKLFRLSPAEAKLAKAIVEGGSVNGYALTHGLAQGTVRFQLKQVLAKTGCARQSDLVRHVCSVMIGPFDL